MKRAFPFLVLVLLPAALACAQAQPASPQVPQSAPPQVAIRAVIAA